LKIVTTNSIDPALWDNFVERHPLGTIYHHSLWQDVIKKTYGYQPLYHLLQEDSSGLQAAISSAFVKSRLTGNRIISYPFSDTCDPLVESSEQLRVLIEAVERSRAELNARFVELRFAKAHRFIDNYPSRSEYHTYHLALDRQPEVLFRSFHKNCIQRAVRKAKREALEIVIGKTEEDMKAFYRLNLMTRKKHGVPVQPSRFFRNLWDTLFPRGMLSLLLALYKGKAIGGVIVLWFKGIAYYKFGASDKNFIQLRGNQLLMWEAVLLAQKKGCHTFDFGRTSSTNEELSEYKSRWGTEKIPLAYLQIPTVGKSEALVESSRKHAYLKKIMTHMPALINRISGELLYRHFA
jgi:CelD/BcsL family acetyltransferase involved in cellulose biosynthesis